MPQYFSFNPTQPNAWMDRTHVHLWPGSSPKPYARQSSMCYLYLWDASLNRTLVLPQVIFGLQFTSVELLIRPPIGERGVLSWACVCLCVCLSAIISSELQVRSSPYFYACYGLITIAIRARFDYDSSTIQHPTRSYVLSSSNEHVNSFPLL